MQYVVLPLNGSEYYMKYTFKAIHILAILNPDTHLVYRFNVSSLTGIQPLASKCLLLHGVIIV